MVSKLNQREFDSEPKNTNAVDESTPTTLPMVNGWSGSEPKPVANVHVAISRIGFHGSSPRLPASWACGRSTSGRRSIERLAHASENTGRPIENAMM